MTASSPDLDPATGSAPGPLGFDRRTLLHRVGLGALTAVVAATGVAGYRVHDTGVLAAGTGTPYDAWDRWDTDPTPLGAVAAAVLAANPHITQAWTFGVGDSAVYVYSDPARRMPAVDPPDREHQVGLGCALENLVLGLSARGFASTVTLLPDPADPGHVARVVLGPGVQDRPARYTAIGDRHTERGPYATTEVSGATARTLAADRDDLPGVRLRWLATAAEEATMGGLLVDATVAFVADEAGSRQAFDWFRPDQDAVEDRRDGLGLDMQGLDPLTLTLAKLLPATSRAGGDQFWLTRTVHTATAAAYGVVTTTDPDDAALRLTAGRLLQRAHLDATVAGLGLHHMNQVTEAMDREAARGVTATFAPRFLDLIDDPGQRPVATFRIGVPTRTARRSPRRSLAAVTR